MTYILTNVRPVPIGWHANGMSGAASLKAPKDGGKGRKETRKRERKERKKGKVKNKERGQRAMGPIWHA